MDLLMDGAVQLESIDLDKLTRIATELTNGAECMALESMTRIGSKNIIIFLAFDDEKNTRWIARFSLLGRQASDNSCLAEAIESMVVTMQYVADHTSIPVPKVHHWDGTSANELGRPYTIMDAMKGNSLVELERAGCKLETITHALPAFIEQWAIYNAELAALQFDRIGSFRWDSAGNVILDKLCSRTTRMLSNPKSFDHLRGPFYSVPEYLLSISELKLLAVATDATSTTDLQRNFLRSKLAESLISYYLDSELSRGPFVLTHGDLGLQHILVDETRGYKITGIIDWDLAAILPIQSHVRLPDLLICDLWPSHKQQVHGITSWHIEFAWNNRDLFKSALMNQLKKLDFSFAVEKLLESDQLFPVLEKALSDVPDVPDLDLLWGRVYGAQFNWRDAIRAMETADWGMAMAERMSICSEPDAREEGNGNSKESRTAVADANCPSRPTTEKSDSVVLRVHTNWSKRMENKVRWGWWHTEQLLLCRFGTPRVQLLMRPSPSDRRTSVRYATRADHQEQQTNKIRRHSDFQNERLS